MKSTLNDNREPTEICNERGWEVGTRLVGDEGYGPTVIEITAIGKKSILAETISHDGESISGSETSWVFWCRDWKEVPNAGGNSAGEASPMEPKAE